jgi:hypothetical protein
MTSILGQSGLGSAKRKGSGVPTGPTALTGADQQHSEHAEHDEHETVHVPAPRTRRKKAKAAESVPQTVYFTPADLDVAADVAHAVKKSGRLKGLLRGHIGVSLVVAYALDELRESFEENPTAVIDRIIVMVSRRLPA